jgi:hypothetical protein
MRAPPPVEFASALGRAWRAGLSLLVSASVAAPLAWGLPHIAAHWGGSRPDAFVDMVANPRMQAALAAWVAAMVAAAVWLDSKRRAACERLLRWDGQEWLLAGDARTPEQRGDAALMLDLGVWMLVRFLPHAGSGGGGATWLPLSLAGDLARWAALRGALWNWRSGAGRAGP